MEAYSGHQHLAGDFRSRIRVRSISSDPAGPLCAAREAVLQLGSEERFVLLLAEDATLFPDWDQHLCEDWFKLGNQAAVLTGSPREASDGPSNSTDLQRILRTHVHQSAPRTPSFPVLSDYGRGRLPSVLSMPFPVPPKIPSQTIVASCALCFLSLEAWSRAVSSSSNLFELPCAPYAADVALSSALHTAAARPSPRPVRSQCARGDLQFRPKRWNREGVQYRHLDPAYCEFAGIGPKFVAGRGRMGLTPFNDTVHLDEVLVKYGSTTEFQRLQRSL